jgi:ribonuclease D
MLDAPPLVHATTADAVGRWLAEAAGARVVAVDTETTGWDPWRDELLLVQVSAGPEPAGARPRRGRSTRGRSPRCWATPRC